MSSNRFLIALDHRLQFPREQQACQGVNSDPSIGPEIEATEPVLALFLKWAKLYQARYNDQIKWSEDFAATHTKTAYED